MSEFAARVERVEPSATLAISNLANELEAEGIELDELSAEQSEYMDSWQFGT